MNLLSLLSAILFLVWSVFCSWWYTCRIKSLCSPDKTSEIQIEPAQPQSEMTPTSADTSELARIEVKKEKEKIPAPEEEPSISLEYNSICFQLNSTDYVNSNTALNLLDSLHEKLAYRDIRIEVTGHTCSLGTEEYNYTLGLKRANRIKKDLIDIGWEERIIMVSSEGESHPLNTNANEAERQRNRRVEITLKSNNL